MRVLVLSQYYWPEGFQINDVVRSLVARGTDVDVLTGKPNYPEGAVFRGYRAWGCLVEKREGANIYRVPLLPRGANSALRLAMNYLSFVVAGLLCGPWLLRGRRYDCIFVYAPSPILQVLPALFLGWIKRCGVIVWVQDLWPDSLEATGYVRNPRLLRVVEMLVRVIYRNTDLLLVQSHAFVAPVTQLAAGRPVAYLPNSVDPVFYNPPTVPVPEITELNSGFPVVFAGNVGAAQAVETIVEAATLLMGHPHIRFVVFGQGSRRNWMLAQVEALGLTNLHLAGRFPVETMPGLLRKAAVLLVTLADEPIFRATVPNKIQAYMAVGRPILACLNGEGARLVVESGAGIAVPAQDARRLADAVLQLYAMAQDARDRLGENGRRYFKANFDHDQLVDQLLVHFNSVLQERQSP